jgi:phosphorylcholine metabolism protein LicD
MVGIFDKHNIKNVCFYGTLLGVLRHGDIIPWDDDIDICVETKYIDKIWALRKEFKKQGLKIYKCNPGFRVLYKGSWADIFQIYNRNGYLFFSYPKFNYMIAQMFEKDKMPKWKHVFPLKKMYCRDLEVYVPRKAKKVIKDLIAKDCLDVALYSRANAHYIQFLIPYASFLENNVFPIITKIIPASWFINFGKKIV